ncbi:hypothetical protein AB6A40_002896 [Gnathostoma spinigerum]|uniref:Uncharacterized protein n=1 Tax=Gnathostoma spinigerum TaxID=75299 RepID=A0ABD6EHN4_9BILA
MISQPLGSILQFQCLEVKLLSAEILVANKENPGVHRSVKQPVGFFEKINSLRAETNTEMANLQFGAIVAEKVQSGWLCFPHQYR